MFYLLNPSLTWVRRQSSCYVVSVANRVFELQGSQVCWLLEELLPFFSEPRERGEVWDRFAPRGLAERALASLSPLCSIFALLVLPTLREPSSAELFRGMGDDTPSQESPLREIEIRFRGPEALKGLLEASLDVTHRLVEPDDLGRASSNPDSPSGFELRRERPTRIAIDVSCSESPAQLLETNRVMVRRGEWWIPVRIGLFEATVGPMVVPYQTPCFECAVARLCASSTESGLIRDLLLGDLPRFASENSAWSRALATQAMGLVATELSLFSHATALSGLIGRVVTASQLSLGAQYHRVLRIPFCAACGWSPTAPQHPWASIGISVDAVLGRG